MGEAYQKIQIRKTRSENANQENEFHKITPRKKCGFTKKKKFHKIS